MTTMKQIGATTLAGMAILTIAGAVWAATTFNAPGAYCVPTNGGSLNVRGDGEIENTSGSTVTAVCPAERPVGTGGTSKVSGTAFVVDQSATGNVCCKVVSKNAGGAIVQSSPVCSSGNSSGYQVLSLPEITDGFSYSHYSVQCDVPPVYGGAASRIQMYRTTQQ